MKKKMENKIKEDEFILRADACKCNDIKDPLGRIEFDEKINKYFCEMTEEDKKEFFDAIDKERSSVINEELLQKIVEFYERA